MKKNNKGFTLAELLIVVAIIAVLVAIAIPVFTTQLEKSKEATDIANVRSAYANIVAQYITEGKEQSMTVSARQGQSGWQGQSGILTTQVDGAESQLEFSAKTSGNSYMVKISVDATTSKAKVTVD